MLTFTDDPPLWGPSLSHLQEKRTFPHSVGYRRQNTKLSLAGKYACEWVNPSVCVYGCARLFLFFAFVITPPLFIRYKELCEKVTYLLADGLTQEGNSANLYYERPFFWLLSSLFFVKWKWNFGTSESVISNRRTKQRFVNMPSAVIDVIITRDENRRRVNEWTVRVLKVFT